MINVLPHDNEVMVVYQGHLTREEPGKPEADWVVLRGDRIHVDELDALFTERMLFDWQGEPFKLLSYNDGVVAGLFLGGSTPWAREHNLEGDQYTGWYGQFPEAEIDNVRVEKSDLLAAWRYQKEMGTKSPPGLYRSVRPATSQEWTKD
jgi:hypothetical protein